MESLFSKKDQLLRLTQTTLVREMLNRIDWNNQLLCLRGSRGVGKTTLMLQYIKNNYKPGSREVLYCSLDSIYFSSRTLLDTATEFYRNGGRHLFVDEVHKYKGWSQEIKEIYDTYPDMRVVISGSSLLNIMSGDADLSRRCIPYDIQGLSFREFLEFYKDIHIPPVQLKDILSSPESLCASVLEQCQPLPFFQEYLKYGYYPFYLRQKAAYYIIIEQVINYITETELPLMFNMEPAMSRKLKALLGAVANSVPFEVDATKLAALIGAHRTTVVNYLYMLGRAKLLNLLFSENKTVKKLQKPDKVYLENPNLMYALANDSVQIGTVRETFAVNQLSAGHRVEYGKEHGDFRVDGTWTFEVGGEKKGFKQIADIPNSFILADGIEMPYGNKLPLWIIGFMY